MLSTPSLWKVALLWIESDWLDVVWSPWTKIFWPNQLKQTDPEAKTSPVSQMTQTLTPCRKISPGTIGRSILIRARLAPNICYERSNHSAGTCTPAATWGFTICVTTPDLHLAWFRAHLHLLMLAKITKAYMVLLWKLIPRYGLPFIIGSDDGPVFIAWILQKLPELL